MSIAWGRMVGDRRGFALLLVIVVLLLVSLLASQLILQVKTELRSAANSREAAAGRLLAEGGVNLALFRLLDKPEPGTAPEWLGEADFSLGSTYETVLPTGKIEYYAIDEAGKINLNATSSGLMASFLQYKGLKQEEIDVVMDSLQDWRDIDNLTRLNGAEQDYYQKLEPPYIPRNGNFEDPSEFFLLRGTESLQGQFDPYEVFTVYNPGNRLNFDSLSPAVLKFLVDDDAALVEQYRQLKANGLKITDLQAQQLLGPEKFALLRNYLGFNQKSSPFCTIVSRGWAGAGAATPAEERPGMTVMAQVKLDKDGFSYLSWREKYL
jgi:general secretion pathway protein K